MTDLLLFICQVAGILEFVALCFCYAVEMLVEAERMGEDDG